MPIMQPTPQEIGSYDVLGKAVSKAQAATLLQTPESREQQSNLDGSGHRYWVDRRACFSTEDQTDLIQYLLSLDDNPEVLPAPSP